MVIEVGHTERLGIVGDDYAADAAPVRRRWRMIRRRSRSVAPPQTPCFSRMVSACSKHATRTWHPAQTSLASRASSPSSGKNIPGSSPRHAPKSRHTMAFAGTTHSPVMRSEAFPPRSRKSRRGSPNLARGNFHHGHARNSCSLGRSAAQALLRAGDRRATRRQSPAAGRSLRCNWGGQR